MKDQMERLIKEEQETRDLLRKIEEAGDLEQFVLDIDPVSPGFTEMIGDPWDYDRAETHRVGSLTYHLREAYKHLGKVKYWTSWMDNTYQERIREWEDIRKNSKGKEVDAWLGYYKNPRCLELFESYERDHHIKSSIYQDYKKAIAKKKKV